MNDDKSQEFARNYRINKDLKRFLKFLSQNFLIILVFESE
jgi:hypothetical protein